MTTKTKSVKKARKQQMVDSLNGVPLLGEIICWNATGPHAYTKVKEALSVASLPSDIVRDMLPRNAFARAARKLSEDRVIDVLRDEVDTLMFQFTNKKLDGEEWRYSKETTLSLDKTTGKVSCPVAFLEEAAQKELDQCMETRTTSDVTTIVKRLFDQHADLFPVRDQGGVYFVPREHTGFTDQAELFLQHLGGSVNRFPVPSGTAKGDTAIQSTVAEALTNLIQEHNLAVDGLDVLSRKDSVERAAERINATRVKVEAYASYLQDRREELLASLQASQEALVAKVEQISKDRLLPQNDPFGCKPGTESAQINTCLVNTPKTVEEIAKECGLPEARVSSHLKFWLKKNVGILNAEGKWSLPGRGE